MGAAIGALLLAMAVIWIGSMIGETLLVWASRVLLWIDRRNLGSGKEDWDGSEAARRAARYRDHA